jgi:hypothetical protein
MLSLLASFEGDIEINSSLHILHVTAKTQIFGMAGGGAVASSPSLEASPCYNGAVDSVQLAAVLHLQCVACYKANLSSRIFNVNRDCAKIVRQLGN